MQISEIRQTSSERYTIVFEDESELRSTLKVITDHRIYSGRDLNDDDYARLVDDSSYSLCEAHAVKLLSYQPLSKKGLEKKLIQKGRDPEHAARAVEWAEEMGLINDEAYSEMVVRHYAAKGYGAKRIESELYRHGVPKELWEDALRELPCQDDKMDSFIRSRLSDPSDPKQVKRVTDGLFRRGYSWSDIKNALERFRESYEEEDY